jgi:hypothetical protein
VTIVLLIELGTSGVAALSSGGRVVVSSDNWGCERQDIEHWRTYVQRNIAHARRYLEPYTPPPDIQEHIYVLVSTSADVW